MHISNYKEIFQDVNLDTVVSGLIYGLRADIPYSDTQTFTKARLTADVVKGNQIALFDNEYSGKDTVDLMLEMENGIRVILQDDFDPNVQNGGGLTAVLRI